MTVAMKKKKKGFFVHDVRTTAQHNVGLDQEKEQEHQLDFFNMNLLCLLLLQYNAGLNSLHFSLFLQFFSSLNLFSPFFFNLIIFIYIFIKSI